MSQTLTTEQCDWVTAFCGVDPRSAGPAAGAKAGPGASAGKAPPGSAALKAPHLTVSPEIAASVMKMGIEDKLKGNPPNAKFKPGDGALSDAYWQGYTGKAPGAAAPPAPPDKVVTESYQAGFKDGMAHRASLPPLAGGSKAKEAYLKGYDAGWPPILRVVPGAGAAGTGPAPQSSAPTKEKDGPEVSVEVDPVKQTVETQVKYTIKLRAVDEDAKPPTIQVLPDQEITVHIDSPDKPPPIEAQLNVIKATISKALPGGRRLRIEGTVSISAQMDLEKAAAGKIAKSLELKIKAELELHVTKTMSIKPGVAAAPGEKPVPGITWQITF